MIGAGRRTDYVRNFQVGVAQIVVLFYALLLIPIGFSGSAGTVLVETGVGAIVGYGLAALEVAPDHRIDR